MRGSSAIRTVICVETITQRTDEYRRAEQLVLDDSDLDSRWIEVGAGHKVRLLERGHGVPMVMLHGTGPGASFLRPLLDRLDGIRVIAPDRPGQGLSVPIAMTRHEFRDRAVRWVDQLLDALEVDRVALAGHSMGGLWALWYALACPERVTRLVLLAPPQLPGTRCPLPFRLMGTPGLFRLVQRLSPPSPRSSLQFAKLVGEGDTLVDHPDLVDVMVAGGKDPVMVGTNMNEARAIVSPAALITPSGFRRRMRVRPDELGRITAPTLVVWGDREPLGSVDVAQQIARLIPNATLEVVPAGHAPWLGQPDLTAKLINEFAL
jgi:pimeloyl-ACP methyl ester carboxylesterase